MILANPAGGDLGEISSSLRLGLGRGAELEILSVTARKKRRTKRGEGTQGRSQKRSYKKCGAYHWEGVWSLSLISPSNVYLGGTGRFCI